ncbi:TonB-dependent receptor [Danxiaibacter flavus]|uniref:TonB-dependent receptor n=1 Tax=Danxiaibacter flavus TaxID=3049108 RepID=A0ABV3ZLJ1_9BACT|nr:TonB-dependent receptor [Chitinophagaceae bacterium DXS]
MKKLLFTNFNRSYHDWRARGYIKPAAVMLILFCSALAQAQAPVRGKVTGDKGEPIQGASVQLKHSNKGVATDANGNFSLSLKVGDTLIISSLSYNPYEYVVRNTNSIAVSMTGQPNASNLGDVVVVGFGTQKRVSVTGSVSTLKATEIVTTKNENVANMLTGKIPGLRMVQRTAEPGAYENSFDIRGYGGAPLIVIDGVPRGGFERMDPSEIESISVLKDASAAVYGVNGGNGVILVTTKKGGSKDGKFDINYSFNQGWQQFLGMPEAVGPVDYMMLTNEKTKRDFGNNFISNVPPSYSYDNIKPWMDGTYAGANWPDAAFTKVSPQVQHNINISGGTDKVNTFISLGYMKQSGLLQTNSLNYDRWNIRSNVNVKVTNNLRAQLLLSGVSDTKNAPYQDLWTIFKYAWNQIPINQIYANNNPEYLNVMPDNVNPVAVVDASKVGFKKNTTKNLQAQGSLEWEIPWVKGLKAKGMYNYGYTINDNTAYAKMYNLYAYNADDSTYKPTTVSATGLAVPTLNRAYYSGISTLGQLSLTYANSFAGVHNISGLFVYEESHSKNDNIYAQRNMPIPTPYLFGGVSGTGEQGGTYSNGVGEFATRSYVGRINYDYRGKYIAEFSFREDASNRFKPGGKQWGFFPGYSVGYRISEESFFKNLVSPNIISSLKIRASYSALGTSDDRAQFQYVSGYTYPTVDPADNKVLGYMMGGQFVTGLQSRGLTNPDLTWYTNYISNLALDFTLLKGKLDGTIEVFRRNQEGLLNKRTAQLPGTVGSPLPYENLDSRRTQGIEGILTYKDRFGALGLTVSGNAAFERTKNLHVTEGPQGNQYLQWRNGASNRFTGMVWGTDYGGQYTSYNQIYNSKVNAGGGNNSVLPGDYYMEDWNGDGVINADDYHPIAVQDLPLINYGLTIGATYKGLDLTALFAGAAGVWTSYGEQLGEPLMYGRSALTKFLDSWHTVNPDDNVYDPNTQWIPGKYPSMGYAYGQISHSTKGIINASYVRLKTIELGYTLPHQLLQKVRIKNCRIYVNAYNLLTITGLEDGVDPEHPGSFPDASFDQALGGYKYPLNRTFNVGGTITF